MKNQNTFTTQKPTYSYKEKLCYYEELCDILLLAFYEAKRISFNTMLTRTCHIQDISSKWQDLRLLKSMYESLCAEAESYHFNIKQTIYHYKSTR